MPAAAYIRREVTADLAGGKTIRAHVAVWDNGSRVEDHTLDDGTHAELHELAAAILSPRWAVGEFIVPPWHRPLDAPDEMDHRADVWPLIVAKR